MDKSSVNSMSLEYVEQLYADYAAGRTPVPPEWQAYFDHLQNGRSQPISVQCEHIHEQAVRDWAVRRMGDAHERFKLSSAEQIGILTRLIDAVIFEESIRRRYAGAKTFSLEGAESLIPLLDWALETAGQQGVEEVVVAMAHRGRLNVLANVLGKRPAEIFREFEDGHSASRGDVSYHLGYHNYWTTAAGRTLHVTLCFNPSHLEFVDPVALGLTRAKQDRRADCERRRAMAILIHGDAAFAGEGIVQETLNLSQLPAYTTGGALHVILDNQIGFTTPPSEGRSSPGAGDAAKMLQVPVLVVDGGQPEAVVQAVGLAMDFRAAFHRDILIDMLCFRRWGHNEGDDPSFTQPLLYEAIQRRKSVHETYIEQLTASGAIAAEAAGRLVQERHDCLERELSEPPGEAGATAGSSSSAARPRPLGELWKRYYGGLERPDDDPETGIPKAQLVNLFERLTELPKDFHLHRKLVRWLENRRAMAHGERPVDWATAEALALASLAVAGYRVRMTGQDSARGTFSQRHAVLHDTADDATYVPLQHLASDQAFVEVVNSPLSEAGALGFEYGFTLGYPDALVLWEAQFGDFVNAAQVLIDQFLASAEVKWQHLSGLVLLLPHGVEGQGPEHSSGRLERFLQLSADDNWQVVVPGTPAQYFHCLRRQAIRRWQKPLVVFTPKGLLRHPGNVSALEDFTAGRFQRVLPDRAPPADRVERVLLCAGKVYFDLSEYRGKQRRDDVALVRLEQLYPLPGRQLLAALQPYPAGTQVCWVQEEPENMGAWRYLKHALGERIFGRYPLAGISRPASGSPATGSSHRYRQQQQELVEKAFSLPPLPVATGDLSLQGIAVPWHKS